VFGRLKKPLRPAAQPAALAAAIAHHQAGQIADAETLYRKILEIDPENHDALHLLGVVSVQQGKPQDAVVLISRALAGNPENHHALSNLGEAYRASGLLDEAKICFERALMLRADVFQAYNGLGNIYQASGNLDIAKSCYQKAIEINRDYADAHTNLGNAFTESGDCEAALACYTRALELRPDLAEASFNLGNVYKLLQRYDEAIPRYEKAITLSPEFVEARLALGRAFQETGERERALECFRHVASLQPNNAEARWALVLTELALVHDDQSTVAGYRAAFTRGLSDLDGWFTADRMKDGFGAVGSQQPFYLAYHEENNREILAQYGALCRRLGAYWQDELRLVPRARMPGSHLRIGLVSAHVCNHSVWHAILKGWCENLDSERFQLHVFALGKTVDGETEIAKSRASRFVQGLVRPQQWAEAILAEPLDVLIFAEIGMDPTAVKLASLRLAPVQATTWGHPETSGLPTIDYYISAADFEPANAQDSYSEKLVVLPNLGCCYDPLNTPTEEVALDDLGIDAGQPIFVCPGTPFKYAPQHDWIYPAIARELGSCQFVFFKYQVEALSRRLMQRLKTAFSTAGLAFSEYVLEVPWLSKGQFNSLMLQSTCFLDTIGFSGFNTAMQAIECGLPVVTREGRFLRGRLASGILKRLELTELIVESEEEYVELAVRLARDARFRVDLRRRIQKSRHSLYGDKTAVSALESFLAHVSHA